MLFIAYFPQKAKNVSIGIQLDHLEVILADTAVGALPVRRHSSPAGNRGYGIFRPALHLIVDEATHHTLPLFQMLIPRPAVSQCIRQYRPAPRPTGSVAQRRAVQTCYPLHSDTDTATKGPHA